MLTPGEMVATESALADLLASVEEVEAIARGARNLLAWIGIEDDLARNARETAEAKRGLYNALAGVRDYLVGSPEEDHERVAEIVSLAYGSIGRDSAGALRDMVDSNDPLHMLARAAIDTAHNAGAALQIGVPVAIVALLVYIAIRE